MVGNFSNASEMIMTCDCTERTLHTFASMAEARKRLLLPYQPPAFYVPSEHPNAVIPNVRVALANLPTPIFPWTLPELPEDIALDIKRDDYTGGVELTGNKVRKLEFLLGDAVAQSADMIVSAGGTQSNHARATAAACARLAALPCVLYLRKDSEGRNGNLLIDRMVGATVHEVSADQVREWKLETTHWVERRAELLAEATQSRVVGIPIGGSNALGCWGYLNAVGELATQLGNDIESTYSDIVACTGSGATAGGLGVGLHLYRKSKGLDASLLRLRSYGVSDSPDFFLDYIDGIIKPIFTGPKARDLLSITDAQGLGYAKSTTEELQFISRVARETGVIFDFCYTGKTVFALWKDLKSGVWRPSSGKKALFVHTGGGPSLFDRADLFHDVLPPLA
jgi:D-cysteine desulfhydrase